jgi:hypothetical protein
LFVLQASTQASAQAAGGARPAIARALFEQGVDEATEGNLERARELFLRSREASESVSTLLNLAIVCARLGEWGEALAALDDIEALLREASEDPALARARALRKDISPLVASVALELSPADAQVRSDGAARGQSPQARRLYFSPGEQTLRVEAPGHAPETRTITLTRGEERIESFMLQSLSTVRVTVAKSDGLPPVRLASDARPSPHASLDRAQSHEAPLTTDGKSLRARRRTWGLWLGGAALVVAAGISAAVLLRPAPEGDFPI